MTDNIASKYDMVVVRGGAAGLSGALMPARARRSVLVIDHTGLTAVPGVWVAATGVTP